MIIDHIGLVVSHYENSKQFYLQALKPLDIVLLMEIDGYVGFGRKDAADPIPSFWIHQGELLTKHSHIAFAANSRDQVDQFYKAAILMSGKDNGRPGLRPDYHPNYYGAFVLDLDGNNIEAVCHTVS